MTDGGVILNVSEESHAQQRLLIIAESRGILRLKPQDDRAGVVILSVSEESHAQ